jgi:murein DD-endopeptidase MepM/ murein hydrolase activator NlpD
MHLSEITVNNGTIVKTGDLIGKTGKTGFTNLPGFYFMTTVKDVPVSPYTLWVNGVKLSNP